MCLKIDQSVLSEQTILFSSAKLAATLQTQQVLIARWPAPWRLVARFPGPLITSRILSLTGKLNLNPQNHSTSRSISSNSLSSLNFTIRDNMRCTNCPVTNTSRSNRSDQTTTFPQTKTIFTNRKTLRRTRNKRSNPEIKSQEPLSFLTSEWFTQ